MGTTMNCYACLTEVPTDTAICPKCKARLGHRKESGGSGKQSSSLFKILFVLVMLAVAGKIAMRMHNSNSEAPMVQISTGIVNLKDGAIKRIKEKGAEELRTVGVADIGYADDTLCIYVDQRFNNLTQTQQEALLAIVAGEWTKAIGKTSTAVKVLEYGTKKTLKELMV